MGTFEYTEDIENWLKPFSYFDFWQAVAKFNLKLPNRQECDKKIADGVVDRKLMLDGLKYIAAVQLNKHFQLERKPLVMPDYSATA